MKAVQRKRSKGKRIWITVLQAALFRVEGSPRAPKGFTPVDGTRGRWYKDIDLPVHPECEITDGLAFVSRDLARIRPVLRRLASIPGRICVLHLCVRTRPKLGFLCLRLPRAFLDRLHALNVELEIYADSDDIGVL
jgi:hypothetical protein